MPTVTYTMTFNTIKATLTGVLLALLAVVFLILAGSGIFAPQNASAQVTTSYIQPPSTSCYTPVYNLRVGSLDYLTNGEVTQMQSFLTSQGYFNSAYLGTGRFGAITLRAVINFQAAHGLPATGYFGPMTRAVVQQISCGTTPPPTQTPVTIYNESVQSGAVGTTVTLTGFGFTNDNTILMDGLVAARSIPISSSIAIACTTNPTCHGGINQSIIFTIPSSLSPNCPTGSMCPMFVRQVTAGQYAVTVQNTNGTSNAVTFTVTSATTNNQQLSISGLSAPASLALGQSGTWSVAVVSSGAGNLHYSVTWGDEGTVTNGIMAPQATSVQSTGTFTHAYQRSGNYTPVFTVTDDFGHSVTTSNTVVVTPLY